MKVVKDYISYINNNPDGYWFKRKLYGWGWVPARKQGWFTMGIYVAVVIAIAVCAERENKLMSADEVVAALALSTLLFLVIVWRKGEPPTWQWGSKSSDQ